MSMPMNDVRDPQPRRRGASWWRALPRWTPVALGVGLGLAAGLGYGLAATPQYTATSYVLVVPQPGGDSQRALGFAQAYGRIATGSAVLAGAQAAAGTPAADLRGRVAAATSPDAPMISVTGTSDSGAKAARIADAVARSLTTTGNGTSATTGVRLLLFSPATTPTGPSSPSVTLSAAVGASAGGLLGALALLARRAPQDGQDGYGDTVDAVDGLEPRDDRDHAVPSPSQEHPRAAV
jgi:capsular polysaccharide biosynthesis protein